MQTIGSASTLSSMTTDQLIETATTTYLTSRDFNGYPLRNAIEEFGDNILDVVRHAVESGHVTVVFGDRHPNPYIRALSDEPKEDVLARLDAVSIIGACAYPTADHLKQVVDVREYTDQPYALELALGGAQLGHRAFELRVLENYRNDPRFYYDSDDIWGQIYAKDEAQGLAESDNVFLRFGYAYDAADSKYVAVFLWDLFKLQPEAQQLWRMREITRRTILHPDYYRTQVIGDWPERISIYDAFTQELETINRMARAADRPDLFRRDFCSDRPKGFASLLRPTLREFNEFIRLLDSMISDNINLKFFQDDVDFERETERPDGRIQVDRKGSLQILQEWIESKFRPSDPAPMTKIFATFREVRKLRNKPSHSAVEDEFSTHISTNQQDLMVRAYEAIRTLRLILANHPKAKGVEVGEALYKGLIWSK